MLTEELADYSEADLMQMVVLINRDSEATPYNPLDEDNSFQALTAELLRREYKRLGYLRERKGWN